MKEEKKYGDQYMDDACPCTELEMDRLDEVSGGVDRISGKKSKDPENTKEIKLNSGIIV